MTTVDITKNKALAKQAKALYLEAFPKEERIPWGILMLEARRKDIDLTAWMEGDSLCGMTASVTQGDFHFVLFFAVAQSLRGRGYGSKILSEIRSRYDTVALNVELLDPAAENYAQRQSRFAFYVKNGFADTGYHVWEVGGEFLVLSTRQQLSVLSYKKVFRKLSFGLWNVRLEKER